MATEPILFEAQAGQEQGPILEAIGQSLKKEFETLRAKRSPIEDEWLKDAAQYMGQYDSSVKIPKGESRLFIPRTRTKVRTLDARVGEIVLPVNKKLWDIAPSPEPELPPERKEWLTNMLTQSALERGIDPSAITKDHLRDLEMELAQAAAKRMSIKVADVLEEGQYYKEARKVYQSGHRYGLGIFKGPLLDKR